jgi:hypothetical protein
MTGIRAVFADRARSPLEYALLVAREAGALAVVVTLAVMALRNWHMPPVARDAIIAGTVVVCACTVAYVALLRPRKTSNAAR